MRKYPQQLLPLAKLPIPLDRNPNELLGKQLGSLKMLGLCILHLDLKLFFGNLESYVYI